MRSIWVASGNYSRRSFLLLATLFAVFLFAPAAVAKISTDFDPNLDFSQLKTFAFIGGVEQLVRLQLNPDQLNNRIHRAVTRELTAKGLREVIPEENADLVVRYWASSHKDVDAASSANWGVYGPYLGYHWGFVHYSMESYTNHQGMLAIELITPKPAGWRGVCLPVSSSSKRTQTKFGRLPMAISKTASKTIRLLRKPSKKKSSGPRTTLPRTLLNLSRQDSSLFQNPSSRSIAALQTSKDDIVARVTRGQVVAA
jgi:Domain of unknown function (DUF4136)